MQALRTLLDRYPKADLPYRAGVASRLCAAVAGGYLLTAGSTALLSLALPMPRASAVLTATMLSFAIYTTAVIVAFSVSNALRAWGWLAAPGIIVSAAAWVLYGSAT
ncbi:iron uptake protein [Bordetella ansorpii]|uniref:Iron uptake protein n=1 Tax=Bordetella ansorpii TaxID=288768 RepID=A0A157PIL0_9BORD|nr:hypothetical protein [Bordetella ansorpii]SAI33317.1 iron uptake protein [Bordetella ansorpii]